MTCLRFYGTNYSLQYQRATTELKIPFCAINANLKREIVLETTFTEIEVTHDTQKQ